MRTKRIYEQPSSEFHSYLQAELRVYLKRIKTSLQYGCVFSMTNLKEIQCRPQRYKVNKYETIAYDIRERH